MKKVIYIAEIMAVMILLLTATLSCSASNLTASLGKQFTLTIGKTVTISGEGLNIGFEEVNGDSRCATGNECVWEGEAKCRGTVTYAGQTNVIIFYEEGSTATDQVLVKGYSAHYTLEPYPVAGKTIAKSDYYLAMTVTKE